MTLSPNNALYQKLKSTTDLINNHNISVAEAQCTSMIDKYPDHPGPLFLLGHIRYYQNRWEEAIELLEKSHNIFPEENKCINILLASYIDGGQTDKAVAFATALLDNNPNNAQLIIIYTLFCKICLWEQAEHIQKDVFKAVRKRGPELKSLLPGFLLYLNALPGIDARTLFSLHQSVETLIDQLQPMPPLSPLQLKPQKKIRIGYLSPDFRKHAVSYFIYPILYSHDREIYEVYCYAHLAEKDNITETIRNAADHFIDITQLSDADLAKRIRDDNIQIVVDLAGHTMNSRVKALTYRAAPVQITYLGYPNTTAYPEVDFRITDKYAEDSTLYSEELLYMPESFLCFGIQADCKRLEATAYRTTGHITFGSFCSAHKINPLEIDLWSRILNSVPDAKFALKARWKSEIVKNSIINEFIKHGINKNRLLFLPLVSNYNKHLEHYNIVDIALDTFPYCGTTTTCEALMMGVPVITLVGPLHAQRVSYSILKNIGFEETITFSHDDYIAKAIQLAANPDGLDILRKTLPILLKHSITGQPEQFTRQLEALYLEACQKKGIDLSQLSAN